MALYKLHKTLCVFQLDDENVEDIVNLARYAYSEEGKGLEEGIGGLRGLVCQYMATNAVVLSHDDGFMDDYGRTPLSWAEEDGHEAVVKLLLEMGAKKLE